jgi:hypothetical protein
MKYAIHRREAADQMTIYHGEAEQLAVAQEVLDRHATSSANGLCMTCKKPGPCAVRETAAAMFSRYSRLPRRVPGASRPELVGARRVDVARRLASVGGAS